MSRVRFITTLASAVALGAAHASADCDSITFEQYANGTAITNQYCGVTFSVLNTSCGVVPAEIATPAGGTLSPTRALASANCAPDVNSETLIITFTELQSEVRFAYGATIGGNVALRSFNNAGVVVQTQNIAASNAVFRAVRFTGSGGNLIRRIEIGPVSAFATLYVDDLEFDNSSRPIAVIDTPLDNACLCGNSVAVRGTVCGPVGCDDLYARDRLEYQPFPSPAGAPWTLIGDATSAACGDNEQLYTWNIAALPEGSYKLLLTTETDCGYSASAVSVVHVDRSFDTLIMRQPVSTRSYGGIVCFDGTADDECFSSYDLEWRPSAGGAFQPILHSLVRVINDPLGSWNTIGRADGNYEVRLTGTTTCGNSGSVSRIIEVDNTAPVAEITSPIWCDAVEGIVQVRGRAYDANLTTWTLQYMQPVTGIWVNITSSNVAVPGPNGLLANWDTRALPNCVYFLRLVVNTDTIVNCDDDVQQAFGYVGVIKGLGCEGDVDHDGDIDLTDLAMLLAVFGSDCP